MASPFAHNKKERRRARKSAAKSAQILEKREGLPEATASSKQVNEIALRIAHGKRFQNKRFKPNNMTPEQLEKALEESKERLRHVEELARRVSETAKELLRG